MTNDAMEGSMGGINNGKCLFFPYRLLVEVQLRSSTPKLYSSVNGNVWLYSWGRSVTIFGLNDGDEGLTSSHLSYIWDQGEV